VPEPARGEPPAGAPPEGAPGLGRARRAIGATAWAVGLGALFVASLGASALLHLDAAPTRRITQRVTNDLLATLFEGKIVADGIEHLDLSGVRIHAATALDPSGRPVIRASGVRARADVIGIAAGALFGPEVAIEIPDIRLEHAEVLVEAGATGAPTLADTFTPRKKEPSKEPSTPSAAPSRPVRVSLPRIAIGTAWVHGAVAPPRSLDADLSRLVGSVLVTPEGVAVDVERAGLVDRVFLPARTAGVASYHLRAGATSRMWATFAGHLGPVEVLARGELDDGKLSATGEIPSASPDELAALLPFAPPRERLAARVDVEGVLPYLDVEARVGAGERDAPVNSLEVRGRLEAASPLRLDLYAVARAIDPSLVRADLPPGGVSAEGRVAIVLTEPSPTVIVEAHSAPAILGAEVIPAAEAHAALVGGELTGAVRVHEPGMPTVATFALPADGTVRFDATADIPSLAAAPRLSRGLTGGARVHAEGTVGAGGLDAAVDGRVSGLRAAGAALGAGSIRGRLRGPLDALALDAHLTGSGLSAAGYDFTHVRADARGSLERLRITTDLASDDTGATVKAKGDLDTRALAIERLEADLRRDDTAMLAKVARIAPARGGVRIDGIELHGEDLGDARGSLRVEGGDLYGTIRGDALDLERAAKLLGFPHRVKGLANVDVALERVKGGGRKGHVSVELEGGRVAFVPGLSAQLAATFDGEAVAGGGFVRLIGDEGDCAGPIAGVVLSSAEGVLRGPLLDPATWQGATGAATLAADDWKLACLKQLFPVGLPVTKVAGSTTARLRVQRAAGERFPSVRELLFRTRDLDIAGPQDLHDNEPAWEWKNTDARLEGELDGATGAASAKLVLFDDESRLAEVEAHADLDLATLVDEPRARRASLEGAPLQGRVSIERRPLRSLPVLVRRLLPDLAGEIGVDGYVEGTLAMPFVALRASGSSVVPMDGDAPSRWAMPIDLDALLTYDGARASLDAHATKDGVALVVAKSEIDVAWRDLYAGDPKKRVPWTGRVQAELHGVPLGQIPALADSDVSGTASGLLELSGLNDKPVLAADLAFPVLRVGSDLSFSQAGASLRIGSDGVPAGTALGRVELVTKEGGRLDATAYAGVTFRDGYLPAFDLGKPADLYAVATRFRLATFHPLVAAQLSRLDGDLDGQVRIGWNRLADGEEANASADLRVTQGVVHVPQIGQELRDATLHLVADPERGEVRVDGLSAKGLSGSVNGSLRAQLEGLRFEEATGQLTIPANEPLPITLEGVPFGTARGRLDLRATLDEGELAIAVKATDLRIDLPASSSRDVQPLDDHPDVLIVPAISPGKEPRASDALRYSVTLETTDAQVNGTGLTMVIASEAGAPPRVELADEARVSGGIRLAGGTVDVYGKPFKIEEGLVRLRPEEPGNPSVFVTAYWDDPAGSYRVFVEYSGLLRPITNDKIHLSSSPALPTNAILAMVLFNQPPEETLGDASTPTSIGAANQLLSEEIVGRLLGGLATRGLSARLGGTTEGSLRASVAYDLADTLTVRGSYADTLPKGDDTARQAEQAQQATTSQSQRAAEVAVDWRFSRNWLIRGTFAVSPTTQEQATSQTRSGLDLLWQYRY
jgi:translocation and assembly module TamB